jgi:hypothetical protein
VDDRAGAAERHRAGEHLRQAERADGVRREDGLEILALRVEQEPQRRRAERRRVVDREPDVADERGGLTGDAVNRVLVRDVGRDRMRGAAARANPRDDILQWP